MNQFIPQTGGHLLTSDDLVFLQNTFGDGFQGILNAISTSGYYILKDPQFQNLDGTSGTITWGDGYISGLNKNGVIEIFHIPPGELIISTNTNLVLFLQLITSNVGHEGVQISPSPVTYEDGLLKTVHFKRELKLNYMNLDTPLNVSSQTNGPTGLFGFNSSYASYYNSFVVGSYIYADNLPAGTYIQSKTLVSLSRIWHSFCT